MSTAAASIGSSFSGRRRTSSISVGAESCVWENEPMSAAAALPFVPRLALQRVPEVSEWMLDGPDSADSDALDASRRAGVRVSRDKVQQVLPTRTAFPVSSSRSGIPGLRPHRQAPSPPLQRSSSFPNHKQNEDYLEYEVTSALTLKETPRSQHRHDVQRGPWERQSNREDGVSAAPHEGMSASPHVSFALPASSQVQQVVASGSDADAVVPLQSNTSAEVAAVIASIMPSQHVNPLGAAATQMSRHASVMTLYESAHSGALSESGDLQA